jgi:uncharacterized protein YcgL (UPF0745 family)
MHSYVYASQRKPDTYLWLAARDDFGVIPEALSMLLGELHFVLEVQLDEQRKLPHEDSRVVLEHLRTQGWHMQLPPQQTLAVANQAQRSPADDREA